jgi:hypothetical protein
MARKEKNKRKQKKYNKKQFIEIICPACNICKDIGNPFFCYKNIYKKNPKRFASVLKNLINIRRHYNMNNFDVGDINVEQFSEVFCNTGVCNNMFNAFCPILPECHDIFRAQINNESRASSLKHKVIRLKQKHKRKKREIYVCSAYPTFFSSNDEKFKAKVKKILNGDNIIKQDSNKESDGKAEELSHRNVEGKKS